MVKGNANLVRWMHATPWKQDVESCDRVGLIQAMPAGDAEKDREGRQWEQRVELMRDAIIYNRNNPSILFYECGNKAISREHMIEMKAVRDKYDPFGGRAIGNVGYPRSGIRWRNAVHQQKRTSSDVGDRILPRRRFKKVLG